MPFATARRTASPAALGLGARRRRSIAAVAAESRVLLADYLAQEGLDDGAPAALVDLGWSGSQHETLCDLLAAEGRAPLACYLFGAKAKASAWSGLRRGFYFDEGRSGGPATPCRRATSTR